MSLNSTEIEYVLKEMIKIMNLLALTILEHSNRNIEDFNGIARSLEKIQKTIPSLNIKPKFPKENR